MGKEPRVILTELLAHLRAVMLCQAAPSLDTLSAYDDCLDELRRQAGEWTADSVFQVTAILQQALLTAKTSPVPRIAVEMGLLMAARQLTQPPAVSISAVAPRASGKKPRRRLPQSRTSSPYRKKTITAGLMVRKRAVPFPEDEFTPPEPAPAVRPAAREAAAPVPQPVRPVEPAVPAPAAPVVKTAAPADNKAPATPPVQAARPPVESAAYQDVWKKMCAILDKEKKKAVLSCIRNGRVVYIGEGQVIVAFKTAFMVKRANQEDYFKFTDAALSQILGGTYHIQGFLEGDAELSGYEKRVNCPRKRP